MRQSSTICHVGTCRRTDCSDATGCAGAMGSVAFFPRPIVFLDFDGVLNSIRSAIAAGQGMQGLDDPIAVKLVDRLVVEADANVVISSAWRIGRTLPDLRGLLAKAGGRHIAERVIDKTGQMPPNRGAEIALWLAENTDKHDGRFVIIDDDSDMLPEQARHFVKVSSRDGFGIPEYHRAMEIIAPEHKHVQSLSYYVGWRAGEQPSKVLEWEET